MKKLLVLVALAGCAQQARVQTDAEAEAERAGNAAISRQYEERNAGISPEDRYRQALARIDAEDREMHAAAICRERGNMAAAQPAFGGFGMAGAINAGVAQGVAGSQVEAACLRAWQATGVMPSY